MDESSRENVPSAQGTFADTPLSHVLIHALTQELTGTFELVFRGSPSGTVLVIDGRAAKARTMVDHYLLRVMQQVGILSEGQVHNWLPRLLMGEELHGRALVKNRVLSEAQLEAGLRAQLVRQMQTIAESPPDTTWRYFDGIDLLAGWGEESPVRLDPHPFIWSSLRQYPPWEHVNAALEQMSESALRLKEEAETDLFELEKPLGSIVDIMRTKAWRLDALAPAAGVDADLAKLVVYALMLGQHVELVAASEADAAPRAAKRPAQASPGRYFAEEEPAPAAPVAVPAAAAPVAPVAAPAPAPVPPAPAAAAAAPEPDWLEIEPDSGMGAVARAPVAPEPPRAAEPPAEPVAPAAKGPPRPAARVQAPAAPRAKDPPTLVPRTPLPPAPTAAAPLPAADVAPPSPAPPPPVAVADEAEPEPNSEQPTVIARTPTYSRPAPAEPRHPTPRGIASVTASVEQRARPKDPPTLVPFTPPPPPPPVAPTPVVTAAPAREASPAVEVAAVKKSAPPDLEEPGFDVPLRSPEAPTKPDVGDGEVHTRSTAKEMAAVTRAQEAEYLAQLEKEAPAKPPEDVEPPAPQPQRPAVSPSFAGARPLPPPPPIRKLPPLGRLGQPARPGTPIVSPPSLDTDTRSAIVPEPPVAPLPARPPTSPEVTATTASRSIDITTKPGDDRPSAVAPYSARKTLEVPIDRALIDATLAAASTRATVELLPTPAPAAVAPAPAPSRPTLEIDSPFDSGWDDLEPPATPVREVAPELVEEAAGLGPSGKTK